MAQAKSVRGLTPLEEEAIIKSRFLTQASVSRGEPPFRKLAKRFANLCEEAQSGSVESTQEAYENFTREISLIQLQVERTRAIATANELEQQGYMKKQQQLQAEIEQAKIDIEAKKLELEQARIVRQQNEEYEVLRHLIVQHPPRSATQKEIDRVNRNIEKITAEGTRIAATLQKRRQQFALLFHVIEDLQRSPDDDAEQQGAALGEDAADAQQMEVDT